MGARRRVALGVVGAASYRFTDYARVGVPLVAIALAASVAVLPLLWPL